MGATITVKAGAGPGIAQDLRRLRVNASNMQPAMERVAQAVVDANRDQFEREGRHYGAGWKPLSPRYKAYKLRVRPGKPILEFDGRLRRTAAPVVARNAGFYQVSSRRAEVGLTYAQVPYAQYHQEGTRAMPQRKIMGDLTREDQKNVAKIVHRWIMNGLEVTR